MSMLTVPEWCKYCLANSAIELDGMALWGINTDKHAFQCAAVSEERARRWLMSLKAVLARSTTQQF